MSMGAEGLVLGLSCHYHDSAACLMRGGRVLAMAQEERFTRRKNASEFPIQALNYCLQEAGATVRDLDAIAFYEKPYLKFARVLISHLRAYPRSWRGFVGTMPDWLRERLSLPVFLRRELGYGGRVLFLKHHLSHAASAFLPSPFEEAAILTADAVGEWATMTRGLGRGARISVTKELRYPHSLGLLYTAVTTFLGFEAHGGEGTVMALAALGRPAYAPAFARIVSLEGDGGLRLDASYFDFTGGARMYSPRLEEALGPARQPGAPLEERHQDIAATLQATIEEALVRAARRLQAETGSPRLCLAGGLFLNCVANHRIMEGSGFKEVFIPPAAGDAGGALGAAAYVSHCLWGAPREHALSPYLGPEARPSEMRRALTRAGLAFRELPDSELLAHTAGRLAAGKIVGWFQGRMEIGPRALGNRSMLGSPSDARMRDALNALKGREGFRPCAPAVLEERAGEYFFMEAPSPYMLLAPRVREEKRTLIPAAIHVDGTARVQTVARESNPRFWSLIRSFEGITGLPLLINTSLNLRGEPIACAPADAVSCFQRSRMDSLVLGNLVVER